MMTTLPAKTRSESRGRKQKGQQGYPCCPFCFVFIYKVMMTACPHCGFSIDGLRDGIASCSHCNRVFDSSLSNRLLSTSWLIRQHKYHGIDQLMSDTKIPEHEAIMVYSFVGESGYSHDEFISVLKQLGISR